MDGIPWREVASWLWQHRLEVLMLLSLLVTVATWGNDARWARVLRAVTIDLVGAMRAAKDKPLDARAVLSSVADVVKKELEEEPASLRPSAVENTQTHDQGEGRKP